MKKTIALSSRMTIRALLVPCLIIITMWLMDQAGIGSRLVPQVTRMR